MLVTRGYLRSPRGTAGSSAVAVSAVVAVSAGRALAVAATGGQRGCQGAGASSCESGDRS